MNINEVIGQRLKACRRAKGMSQDELAKALEYTDRSTIAKMESGKNAIPADIVPKLAFLLGVTESYLSAKLYESLFVFGIDISEDAEGNVQLTDPLTNHTIEYDAADWFKLQCEDAFREVWEELTEENKKSTDQKADGLRDAGYYELNEANRAMIDSLIDSLLKSQSAG